MREYNPFVPAKREQHIGEVLGVFTCKILYPRTLQNMTDFLGFMTGQPIDKFQIGPAAEECRPYLLEALPKLDSEEMIEAIAEIKQLTDMADSVDDFRWATRMWLEEQVHRHGEIVVVQALPKAVNISHPTCIIVNGMPIGLN